jgi:polysaccharide pyruvyl transferase WcaK-like protein
MDIYFLAFNTDSKVGDHGIIKKIVRMVSPAFRERVKIVAYVGTIFDFLSDLSKLSFIVCCKYHSVLFSYLLKKPMLVMNYHPKNAALVHEIALPSRCLLSLEDVFDGRLGLMLQELLKKPEEFTAQLPICEAKRRALSAMQQCVVHAS